MLALVACSDDTTTVVDLDCGLIYSDLRTDWVVDFTQNVSTTLAGCDADASSNGDPLDVDTAAVTYGDVLVTASNDSASFQVLGDIDVSAPVSELIAGIHADTCLALVQVWEDDDNAYVQCIGTLNRGSGVIQATCDSAAVSSAGDGVIDTTCALISSIGATISILP
jgi:hypothetical protein